MLSLLLLLFLPTCVDAEGDRKILFKHRRHNSHGHHTRRSASAKTLGKSSQDTVTNGPSTTSTAAVHDTPQHLDGGSGDNGETNLEADDNNKNDWYTADDEGSSSDDEISQMLGAVGIQCETAHPAEDNTNTHPAELPGVEAFSDELDPIVNANGPASSSDSDYETTKTVCMTYEPANNLKSSNTRRNDVGVKFPAQKTVVKCPV
jgi:hypothetical protein